MKGRSAVVAAVVAGLLLAAVAAPARAAGEAGLALGDSITVGAAAQLQAAGYEVDAAVGRSFVQGLDILRARGSGLPHRVLVNLGTNSGVTASQCDQLLAIVGGGRELTLVTVNIPAAPRIAAASNSVLASCASRGGATLVDWAGYTAAHPGAVCADGIHISCGGAGEYARFVLAGAARGGAAPGSAASGAQARGGGDAPASGAQARGGADAAAEQQRAAEAQRAALEQARAAAAAAEAARLAAQRQRQLDYLHSIGSPAPAGTHGAGTSYEFVPVAVRLSLVANS